MIFIADFDDYILGEKEKNLMNYISNTITQKVK